MFSVPARLRAKRAVSALGLFFLGCSRHVSSDDPAALKLKAENGGPKLGVEDWSHVPVPPEEGPKLAPVAMVVPVRAKPAPDAEIVGVLRVGARVARSATPVTSRDCAGGWYAVRPFGFVCVGPDVTLKLDHPVARAIQIEPDRSKPMPYKYAFLRAIAPNYMRVPTKEEQERYEMRLERHLRNWKKFRDKWDVLEVGANDVPLDANGQAAGPPPEQPRPMDQNERFGGSGDDQVPSWLQGERRIPNLSSFKVPGYAVISNRIKRHGGVALLGSFVGPESAQGRRFAVTTDARLIPADKLKPDSGSPFHGLDLKKIGLPVGFARAKDAHFHRLEGGRFEEAERLSFRQMVPLSGNVRMVGSTRWVETRDGRWLLSEDLGTVAKPSTLPAWVKKNTKWIDISIVNQTLTLWEGDLPVYATLVSTGRDGLGEPGKTLSTPQGIFRVFQKHITTTMDSDVADHEFELRDVPWVMYFKGGYALHAAYWHDDFGRPRSHGCVNLAPIDARYVFLWSTPSVPEHWQATYAGESTEPGTTINIHP
ncbi:MAG TPA: L,D-transpeptidase [Polyangiaceae bacterium]|nr:L,D-transpeptidase [Polyangiaceae bacterium]